MTTEDNILQPEREYFSHMKPAFYGFNSAIGTSQERTPKFNRLNNLDSKRPYSEILKYKFYYKIRTILSALDLSFNREHIHRECLKFYKALPENSHKRNIDYIVPTIVYIECMNRFIFLRHDLLPNYYNISIRSFHARIIEYYKTNKKIYKWHKSAEFRKKYILTILAGVKHQFQLPKDFLEYGKQILDGFFEDLAHRINAIIVGFIVKAIDLKLRLFWERSGTLNQVCKWLGIHQSSISNHKDLIKRMV